MHGKLDFGTFKNAAYHPSQNAQQSFFEKPIYNFMFQMFVQSEKFRKTQEAKVQKGVERQDGKAKFSVEEKMKNLEV